MKIDILATHGSPLGVTSRSVYGDDGRVGVGGAELALLTMCEEWTKEGHTVRLYNNPNYPTPEQGYIQLPVNDYDKKSDRDVIIIFRAPTELIRGSRGMKVWWSTDQYTICDYRKFSTEVEKIVCISPKHQQYFKEVYGIDKTVWIDLPVRVQDYEDKLPKVKNKCIFTSVPDRGLQHLATPWKLIKQQVPDASLVITSDYRLWGNPHPGNEHMRMNFMGLPDVKFLGAIPRRDMVRHQLEAEALVYPCTYEELFCYAVAEAETAGAMPVTTTAGALPTTNMGIINDELFVGTDRFSRKFSEQVIGFLNSPQEVKHQRLEDLRNKSLDRFSPKKVLQLWNDLIFK